MKILHIDDSSIFIRNTKRLLLQKLDVSYDYVNNTSELYNYLSHNTIPEIMIVDLMLENDFDTEPGKKLIEALAKKYPQIKLVVLTGNPDTELQEYLFPMIRHYETKGSDPFLFIQTMAEIVQQSINI